MVLNVCTAVTISYLWVIMVFIMQVTKHVSTLLVSAYYATCVLQVHMRVSCMWGGHLCRAYLVCHKSQSQRNWRAAEWLHAKFSAFTHSKHACAHVHWHMFVKFKLWLHPNYCICKYLQMSFKCCYIRNLIVMEWSLKYLYHF